MMTSSIINSISVIVIIAASCLTQNAEARSGVCPNPATGENTRYNVATEVCCGGNIYDVERGDRPLCCGDGIYNPKDEICCGGEVKSRSEGERCCGFTQWYNADTSICCGHHVHLSKNGRFECCGSAKYNTAEDTCCPVEEEGDITMTTLPGVGQCCGNRVIDPRREICCNGMAHEKTDSLTQCCGNSTYNKMTEMCCDNQSPYTPHSQLCCDGHVHSSDNGAQCCGSESYLASQSSCCHNNLFRGIPELPNVQACCGEVSFFKTNHICCQSTLYERGENVGCCGQDTYDSSTELCCGFADESTSIFEKSSPSEECCGLSTYDPTSQTCCEMASRSFDDIVGGECCGTDPDHVQAFDPSQATCCRGLQGEFLHHVPTGEAQCCDSSILSPIELCDPVGKYPVVKTVETDDAICFDVTYNTATQVCMEDGSIEDLSRNLAVCGIELYDPTAEVCCDDFIRGRFDENGYERECCPGTTISFIPALQTCCMATVRDIPTAESGCCRNQAYSTSTHMCDPRGIIRPLDEVADHPELCGNIPYHPDEYVCCGQRLLGAGEICCMGYPARLLEGSQDGECCGLYAFDPTTEMCCNGIVHMTANSDVFCCGYDLLTDPDNQICCDGYLRERHGGRDGCDGQAAFNPITETVCNGWVFPLSHGDCCDGQAYDDTNHICCNGNIHTRTSERTECCGTQIYETDDLISVCCNGHLSQGQAGLACCGDMTYDPRAESCCMNDLFPFTQSRMAEPIMSCCDADTYQSSQHTCCGGVEHKFISDGECCGIDIIRNPEEEICCGGKVWPRYPGEIAECCGGELIDANYQTCCNDIILYLGDSTECCGGSVINTYMQTCCGGEVQMINDEVGCCNGMSFSSTEQGCCNTQIFDVTTEMCSELNIIMPLESSISDSDEEVNNGANFQLLCDGMEYDVLTETCCGNFVFDLRDDLICCNGKPSDASTGKTSCCEGTPYNPSRFDCCQGELHHKVDDAECCGVSYYQPTKETCCDDHTISTRGERCPNDLPAQQDPQCLCNLRHRSDDIPSACTDGLQTKQQILIAIIADIGSRDSSPSYSIEIVEALRGALPVVPEDANGRIPIVISSHSGCNAPSLRRGQKVAVFLDSGVGFEESTLQLTRSDVIMPYNRRLVGKLNRFLNQLD
eukprot:XP_011677132.1 PREDICTED: uncharacterized protein LOC100892964 [Strongylocentrotus purpuratus]